MHKLLWLLNPFAIIPNPYLAVPKSRTSWRMRRWAWRCIFFMMIMGGSLLFHVGVESTCQQLPHICDVGRPNMLLVWMWGICLFILAWISIDMVCWLSIPDARPAIIRRSWGAMPMLCVMLLAFPSRAFAWTAGKCEWSNAGACFDNAMINSSIIINFVLWNMFNRPILILARLVESFREILVTTFFKDALSGVLAGIWPLFWISISVALSFFTISYALRLFIQWDIVDLQQLGKTILLALCIFGMGGMALQAGEHIRVLIGSGLQEMSAYGVSQAVVNYTTVVEQDDTMLSAKSIYDTNPCPGDTRTQRTTSGIFLNDYTARFLRADAVDIHCPIVDPYQYGFVRVPTHLGPGQADTTDDSYPASSTGAYDDSPSEDEGFLFYYLEPNIQYRVFNTDDATAQDREWLFTHALEGMNIQIQAIPLGIMAILEQVLYLIFVVASFGVWIALCLSLVFAPFVGTHQMLQGQLLNLFSIFKTSWITSMWMGILLGFFNTSATRGAALLVFATGIVGLVLIFVLLAAAGSLFWETLISSTSSTLGSVPRATVGAFQNIGGSAKSVTSAISKGVVARRITGDKSYGRGVTAGNLKPVKRVIDAYQTARSVVTGKVPEDTAFTKGVQQRVRASEPSWYTLKRHERMKPELERLANTPSNSESAPQPGGNTAQPTVSRPQPRMVQSPADAPSSGEPVPQPGGNTAQPATSRPQPRVVQSPADVSSNSESLSQPSSTTGRRAAPPAQPQPRVVQSPAAPSSGEPVPQPSVTTAASPVSRPQPRMVQSPADAPSSGEPTPQPSVTTAASPVSRPQPRMVQSPADTPPSGEPAPQPSVTTAASPVSRLQPRMVQSPADAPSSGEPAPQPSGTTAQPATSRPQPHVVQSPADTPPSGEPTPQPSVTTARPTVSRPQPHVVQSPADTPPSGEPVPQPGGKTARPPVSRPQPHVVQSPADTPPSGEPVPQPSGNTARRAALPVQSQPRVVQSPADAPPSGESAPQPGGKTARPPVSRPQPRVVQSPADAPSSGESAPQPSGNTARSTVSRPQPRVVQSPADTPPSGEPVPQPGGKTARRAALPVQSQPRAVQSPAAPSSDSKKRTIRSRRKV